MTLVCCSVTLAVPQYSDSMVAGGARTDPGAAQSYAGGHSPHTNPVLVLKVSQIVLSFMMYC